MNIARNFDLDNNYSLHVKVNTKTKKDKKSHLSGRKLDHEYENK